MLEAQKHDLKKIQDAIAAGNAKIEAVDPDLRPEARHARIAAIRAETAKKVDGINAEMAKRQAAAREGLDLWTQDAVRRRAKFADDVSIDAALRLATFETLKRSNTKELVEHLKDAVRKNSAALAETVRLEWQNRGDKTRDLSIEFDRLFGRIHDQQAESMYGECSKTAGLADYAQVLVREFVSGVSRPTDRMAAARGAGLVVPQSVDDPAEHAANLSAA